MSENENLSEHLEFSGVEIIILKKKTMILNALVSVLMCII